MCVHDWKIETANGPTSNGVCSLCGKERRFRNSMTDDEVNIIAARSPGRKRHYEDP